MTKKHFDISQPVQLQVIRCGGPLTVRGWDQQAIEIEAEGPAEELEARLEDATLTVEARRTCSVRCPRDTTVKVGRVEGYLSVAHVDQTVGVDTCRGPALLRAIHAGVNFNQVDGGLRAYSIDGSLRVERIGGNASLKSIEGAASVETVGGTLRAQRLAADLVVESVGGDLKARHVAGSVGAERVGGSLRAQGVGGKLDLETVGGNVRVRKLGDLLTVQKVGGNLRASSLNGGMEVGRVGGNLHLEGVLVAEHSYHGEAGGNVTLRLPTSTSARFDLKARGRIRTDLALTVEAQDPNRLVGVLGEGAAQVTLTAGGNVRLREWVGPEVEATEWVEELEGLAEEIERQVEEALREVDFEAISREMESRMAQAQQRLESADWERLGRQAQQAAEAGIAKAQEAIQRALSRMEIWRDEYEARKPSPDEVREKAAAEEPKAEPTTGAGLPASPTPADEPTDEERMAILRMVERGQITPDEGEMLLDTLEE
jgi:hypothetical protein